MKEEQDMCREEVQVNAPLGIGIGGVETRERHSVQITHAENGFIVNIGCKTFISKDWLELSSKLQDYWKDPRKAEKSFYDKENK